MTRQPVLAIALTITFLFSAQEVVSQNADEDELDVLVRKLSALGLSKETGIPQRSAELARIDREKKITALIQKKWRLIQNKLDSTSQNENEILNDVLTIIKADESKPMLEQIADSMIRTEILKKYNESIKEDIDRQSKQGEANRTHLDNGELDFDCADFSSWKEAQEFYESNQSDDPHNLDDDSDGIACERLLH